MTQLGLKITRALAIAALVYVLVTPFAVWVCTGAAATGTLDPGSCEVLRNVPPPEKVAEFVRANFSQGSQVTNAALTDLGPSASAIEGGVYRLITSCASTLILRVTKARNGGGKQVGGQ